MIRPLLHHHVAALDHLAAIVGLRRGVVPAVSEAGFGDLVLDPRRPRERAALPPGGARP
jgi:hypothetical protein